MSKKVLLLHGWSGSDSPHWQSWLAGELAKDYGKVSFLRFSDYDFPDLKLWKQELLDELEAFEPDVVVCHSLATSLWFHLCDDDVMSTQVEKLFLVAPPSLSCDLEELKSFFPSPVPVNLHANETLLITSTNDHYMGVQEAQELGEKLGVERVEFENAGHINSDSGYGEWKWMLKKVKEAF